MKKVRRVTGVTNVWGGETVTKKNRMTTTQKPHERRPGRRQSTRRKTGPWSTINGGII